MDKHSNFQRAISIVDNWPSWKKEYKLTKYSSKHNDTHPQNKCNKQNSKTA